MDELLPAAVPAFRAADIVDSHVARYPGAVTWFSPGSYAKRPPLQSSVANLVCAGDWVRMGERAFGIVGIRLHVERLDRGRKSGDRDRTIVLLGQDGFVVGTEVISELVVMAEILQFGNRISVVHARI